MTPKELAESNAHLIADVANFMSRKLSGKADIDDIRSDAALGLLRAANAYDPARGPFPQYARYKMKMEIIDQLRARNGKRTSKRRHVANSTVSLDVVGGRFGRGGCDIADDRAEPPIHRMILREDTNRALAAMTPYQRALCEAHFIDGVSQVDMARQSGINVVTIASSVRLGKRRARRLLRESA